MNTASPIGPLDAAAWSGAPPEFPALQLERFLGADPPFARVLAAAAIAGLLFVAVIALILGKSWLEYRRDRRERAVRRSVREAFYGRLAEEIPEWESMVPSLSAVERTVLIDELSRSAELLEGAKAADLRRLAETLDLQSEAAASIKSDSRYRRLWGLKLFVRFGWSADPHRLSSHISSDRAEAEAAIRVLANDPDPVTRLAGVDIALRYDGLSVYGMHALHRLIRDDPTPLLRQLARRDAAEPTLLAQLLDVLEHSDSFTGEAPMDGVLDCLDHDSADVRLAACAVLADYGWRPDVRDRVDLTIGDLIDDPSTEIRIAAYRLLGKWGDAAARAKLARAAEEETDPRAQVAIARALGADPADASAGDAQAVEEDLTSWATVDELGPPVSRFPG